MAQAESKQTNVEVTREQNVAEQNAPSVTNPFNSGYGMLTEAVTTLAQVIACSVVLAVSGDEKPHKPLRAWVVVYVCASVASLPLLYWRYRHLKKSAARPDNNAHKQTLLRNQSIGRLNSGSVAAVECFKWVLDCFFLAWFIVGCVWIFSGKSSRSVAPHLYWMTLAIIVIYIAGYVLKFLVCSAMCCCLACILAIGGLTQDSDETNEAAPEAAAVPNDQIV